MWRAFGSTAVAAQPRIRFGTPASTTRADPFRAAESQVNASSGPNAVGRRTTRPAKPRPSPDPPASPDFCSKIPGWGFYAPRVGLLVADPDGRLRHERFALTAPEGQRFTSLRTRTDSAAQLNRGAMQQASPPRPTGHAHVTGLCRRPSLEKLTGLSEPFPQPSLEVSKVLLDKEDVPLPFTIERQARHALSWVQRIDSRSDRGFLALDRKLVR